MKISCCVIFIFSLTGSFFPLLAFELMAPKNFCAVSHSLQVKPEVAVQLTTHLEKRLHVKCTLITQAMGDPFTKNSEILWRREARKILFGFWLDQSQQGESLHLRGIDLKHMLQWSQAKAKLRLPSKASINSVLEQMSRQLVDDLPYVGYFDSQSFYVWSHQTNIRVEFFRPSGVTRHPFLPLVLNYQEQRVSGLKANLRISGGEWKLTSKELNGLKPKIRLWLKAIN